MEISQLSYFKEAAELEHISKAAAALQIPQPYLSQTIKRLEDELGVKLFDRVGKRIFLNDAGRILLKHTNEILTNLNNVSLELNSLSMNEVQDISVSFQCASMLISQLMERVMEQHPKLNFYIYQQFKDSMQTDMDITIYSSEEHNPSKNEMFLMKENLLLALPKNHPLIHKEQITVDDLREERFISLSKTSNLYNIIKKYYEQMDFLPKTCFYIDNPSVMREMLVNNFGLSIIPSQTWYRITRNDIVLKPIQDYPMERSIYLAWNPHKYQTKAVKSCIHQIADYFRMIEAEK